MGEIEDLEKVCGPLLAPDHLYSWQDMEGDPDLPPAERGLYGWYFDRYLQGPSKQRCHSLTRRSLLYVGISPSRAQSSGTLRSRIRYHFAGNISGSTLRTTLACLTRPATRHPLRRVGTNGTIKLTSAGEQALDDWMRKHAWVCWVEHRRPWEIEEQVIRSLYLPLNLMHNEGHPYFEDLRELRRRAMAEARRLPPIQSQRRLAKSRARRPRT